MLEPAFALHLEHMFVTNASCPATAEACQSTERFGYFRRPNSEHISCPAFGNPWDRIHGTRGAAPRRAVRRLHPVAPRQLRLYHPLSGRDLMLVDRISERAPACYGTPKGHSPECSAPRRRQRWHLRISRINQFRPHCSSCSTDLIRRFS